MRSLKRSVTEGLGGGGPSMRRAFSSKGDHHGRAPSLPREHQPKPPSSGGLPKELFGARPLRRSYSGMSDDEDDSFAKDSNERRSKAAIPKAVSIAGLSDSAADDAGGAEESSHDSEFEKALHKVAKEHAKAIRRRVQETTATLNVEIIELRQKVASLIMASQSDRFELEHSDSHSNLAAAIEEMGESFTELEIEAFPSVKTVATPGHSLKPTEPSVRLLTIPGSMPETKESSDNNSNAGLPITAKSTRSAWKTEMDGGDSFSPSFLTGSQTGRAFHTRPVWRKKRRQSVSGQGAENPMLASGGTADFSNDEDTLRRTLSRPGRGARCIINPTSPKRLIWDIFGSILIVYDMIMIPLRVFDIPHSAFTIFMDWFTLVFWTLNMIASLFFGYTANGVVIMVPWHILVHYLRTWFVLDLVIVVPDWIFSIAALTQSEAGDSSATRLLRILRFVRTVRLVRLFKLRWIMVKLNESVDSELVSIIANIAKMIAVLLAINHFIACIWFQIASVEDRTWTEDQNWVTRSGMRDADWHFQYATSFHWSISQFTPASMEVQPQNVLERTFAVTVVVFALVGFSYLVGSITGSLTQLRSMQEESSHQFWSVRRFLRQHEVPSALQLRINKYLEHAWQRKMQTISLKSIPIFSLLSDQLRNELLCAINVPPLHVHPLFLHLDSFSAVTVQRLATTAISRKQMARRDKVFIPSETATHMYFPVTGVLKYYRVIHEECGGDKEVKTERVDGNEDWIAEPVLFTYSWIHLGTLMATTEADLLMIEAKGFSQAIKLNPQAHLCVQGYAAKFLEWLNSIDPDYLSDIAQGEHVSDMIQTFIPGRGSSALLSEPSEAGSPVKNAEPLL